MAMKRLLCGTIFMALCFVWVILGADHEPEYYRMTRTITFERPFTYYFASNYPAVSRVNLDLSLDGGSTWNRRIAHGIPAHWGSNSYEWSFLATPDLWTEHARIAVRTLWASTTNAVLLHEGDMSDKDFAICGIRILTPTNSETVLQPGYKQITWHEAGATSVDIGVSTNGGVSYTRLYTVNSPLPTNSWSVPIMGFSTGRLDFVVQSVGLTDLWDSVTVKVQNQ
jgi:hypothetical protein